jgi:tubulin monoglycylase TTLL15
VVYEENSFFDLRTKKGQFLFFIITIAMSILASQLLPLDDLKNALKFSTKECDACNSSFVSVQKKPTYWIYGKGGDGQWVHVIKVLNLLGFERVTENESSTADLLWAHDYPFNKLKPKVLAMQPHQKVNHFPGCGFITNKVDLATTNMKYIPRAFRLPKDEKEFRAYAENTDKLFVVKHYQHRHIKIKKLDEINFNDNETFIQEFVQKPFLVDGHKFDIGVYVTITSLDPLRVYIYYGDILFRYCPQKYYPFDPSNVDKYVVGDDYLPTWEVPSLSRYYNALGYGMKGSFDAYVRAQGKDPQIIWDQVEDSIRVAILTKQPLLKGLLQSYKNRHNFFEMARFDLIVDDDMKVYLIEANMSPNLSSAHFKQNSLLYEQVIYNLFGLVGVGSYVNRENFKKLDSDTEAMLSSDKNVMVNGHICSQIPCSETCSPVECQLCKPCLSRNEISELHRSYREHVNRGDNKRIFPVPVRDHKKPLDDDDFFKNLSSNNQLITKWFHAKCLSDNSWCN